MCRSVLERRDEASEAQAFTFTEEEMRYLGDGARRGERRGGAQAQAAPPALPGRIWEPLGELRNLSPDAPAALARFSVAYVLSTMSALPVRGIQRGRRPERLRARLRWILLPYGARSAVTTSS